MTWMTRHRKSYSNVNVNVNLKTRRNLEDPSWRQSQR